MANKINVIPIGLVKDVLVQVNDFIFSVNFYILDIEGEIDQIQVGHPSNKNKN